MIFVIALFFIFLDQFTKYIATAQLSLGVPVPIIPDLFNFTLVHNKGAAFGIFGGIEDEFLRLGILWGATAVAILFVIYLYKTEAKGSRLLETALAFILAGAIGNIIDRIRFGYVVDFLDFYINDYHWPAFNIADSCVFVGVAILIIFSNKKKPAKESEDTTSD